jgi:hypothetical protein
MPDITSEAQDAADLAYLHGQSRIAALLGERVRAAETAVGVLANYARYEADGDDWEIGSAELSDAIAGAETALSALRGVRRIADLYAVRIATDLKAAEEKRP